MNNFLIPTIWGYEDVIADGSSGYAGKILHMHPQYRTSIHRHAKKSETLVLRDGLVLVEINQDKLISQVWLDYNQRITIPPGAWHRISAFRETELLELSNTLSPKDIEQEANGGKMSDDEFRALFSEYTSEKNTSIVITVETAKVIAEQIHSKGHKIGFCNGCFDLFHLGHVELLRQARMRCDTLFVGVNSDSSIKKLKGESRPFVPAKGRLGLVAACKFVDYVVIAEETTCLNIVDAIRPDIYVTTDEYNKTGPEARWILAQGKVVEVVERIPGFNTTNTAALVHGRNPEKE